MPPGQPTLRQVASAAHASQSLRAGLAVDFLQNGAGALAQQLFSDLDTQGGRVTLWPAHLGGEQVAAFRISYQATQPKVFTLKHGVAGNRHLAATVEVLVQRALGGD